MAARNVKYAGHIMVAYTPEIAPDRAPAGLNLTVESQSFIAGGVKRPTDAEVAYFGAYKAESWQVDNRTWRFDFWFPHEALSPRL